MIDVIDLKKQYGSLTVLDGITETIHEGEKVVIIGPSGSGKSTFLRCLNLLETPDSGHILIEGQDITAKETNIDLIRRKVSMVFQQFNLFPNLTVFNLRVAQNASISIFVIESGNSISSTRGLNANAQTGISVKSFSNVITPFSLDITVFLNLSSITDNFVEDLYLIWLLFIF